MTDSNRRHLRCKRSALPTELIAHSEGVHSGLPREWQAAFIELCGFRYCGDIFAVDGVFEDPQALVDRNQFDDRGP